MKESQIENKTSIATNDYVRMVDENNNSVKIKKDSFMAAIRDALPSIVSDGSTGAGSVLSIINGALKTRTDANLASVLGVVALSNPQNNTKTQFTSLTHGEDLNTVLTPGNYYTTTSAQTNALQNKPTLTQAANARIIVIMNTNENHGWQFFLCRKQLFMRFIDAGVAGTWQTIL